MDLFAPENLPGVGMGDLQSIAAVCGLLGLAATSGLLIAEGALGTIVFIASALLVLSEKPDLGGSTPAAVIALGFLALAVAARLLLQLRARREATTLAGAAKDAPETKAAQAGIARRERWARQLALVTVGWGGALVGLAWAEWNEVPFRLDDTEAWIGLVVGMFAAAIGGDAAWRFLQGAVRAGGSVLIVGFITCIVAYALNAVSVYVPFVGAAVFLLVALLAVRLRRRDRQKFAGLRILS